MRMIDYLKSKRLILRLGWVSLVLAMLLKPNLGFAQQMKLSVVPPQVQILLKPGVSLLKAFNFENLGDPAVFSFRVVSFQPRGDQGNLVLLDKAEGPIRFSLENADLQLEERFFLPNQKTAQALLLIRATDNAPEGDYYYTLLMISEPPGSQATGGRSSLILGANILVSITRSGLTPTSVKLAQFQVIPRYTIKLLGKSFWILEPGDEIPVILKLANTGQFMVTPQAKIQVKGPFGVNQSKKMLAVNILAHSQRLLTKQELDSCAECQTLPSAVFNGFFFGKYRLSADIGFKDINQKLFAVSEFWVLPVRLTVWVSALFLFSVVLLLFLKKKYES